MTKDTMTRLVATVLVFGCSLPVWAQSRSGRAAYHLHTGDMVAASRYEPRGSLLRVSNPENGRSVVVRVNDRGPFNGNRILDLSTGAFRQLFGGLGRGVGPIEYEVVGGSGASELSYRGMTREQEATRGQEARRKGNKSLRRKSRRHHRGGRHHRR